MEFILDIARLRQTASAEYRHAQRDLVEMEPIAALRAALQRHDNALANAEDRASLACKPGCDWCCHFSIDVRPIEALNIAHFVLTQFPPLAVESFKQTLARNQTQLKALDDEQRSRTNNRCPFLLDKQCSIYPVRPQTCRNYHATDAAGCQRSFEHPEDDGIAPEFAPITFQEGAAQVDAFTRAQRDAGYCTDVFEFNGAILAALSHFTDCQEKVTQRQNPFSEPGYDVPLEFADWEE